MIVGVNILLKYLGFFHGMLLIMILNIVATGLFPMLTTLFGFYGALAARLGLEIPIYRHVQSYAISLSDLAYKSITWLCTWADNIPDCSINVHVGSTN